MNQFTPRELSTLLAALRMWQIRNLPAVGDQRLLEVELETLAKSHGAALDEEEMQQLAAKLQSQMPDEKPASTAQCRCCRRQYPLSELEYHNTWEQICKSCLDRRYDSDGRLKQI